MVPLAEGGLRDFAGPFAASLSCGAGGSGGSATTGAGGGGAGRRLELEGGGGITTAARLNNSTARPPATTQATAAATRAGHQRRPLLRSPVASVPDVAAEAGHSDSSRSRHTSV